MSNHLDNLGPGRSLPRIVPWRVRPLPAPAGRATPYQPWVTLQSSMTRALGQRLGSAPSVLPTFEGPGRLAAWEAALLRMRSRRGYVREVTLTLGDAPVLRARTLSRLGDPAVEVLRRLSDRPLAEVLFQDPDWQRLTAPIPIIELGPDRLGRAAVWGYHGRRGGHEHGRILVCEYFEPVLATTEPVRR